MRGVVAFVAEPDAGAAEVLGCEQPVAELVGDLLDPALSRCVQAPGKQLDTAASVEVPDYLLVRHRRITTSGTCEGNAASDVQPNCLAMARVMALRTVIKSRPVVFGEI